jgi:hypothetical protein
MKTHPVSFNHKIIFPLNVVRNFINRSDGFAGGGRQKIGERRTQI